MGKGNNGLPPYLRLEQSTNTENLAEGRYVPYPTVGRPCVYHGQSRVFFSGVCSVSRSHEELTVPEDQVRDEARGAPCRQGIDQDLCVYERWGGQIPTGS